MNDDCRIDTMKDSDECSYNIFTKSFATNYFISMKRKRTHWSGENPYSCEVCTKSFTTIDDVIYIYIYYTSKWSTHSFLIRTSLYIIILLEFDTIFFVL